MNKKFAIPELEIIDFTNDDIITGSGDGTHGDTECVPGDFGYPNCL